MKYITKNTILVLPFAKHNTIGVNMGGLKCGTLDFRLRGRRLTRIYANKNRRLFAPNGTMWSFHNQISINILVTRCRKHCWSASRAFSYSFCPKNTFEMQSGMKIVAIFREFAFSRNKAKARNVFAKMREERRNAGFPARLRDG